MIDNIKKVNVKCNGRIVGFLMEMENSLVAFQYSSDWVKNGFSISPISLPLGDDIYIPKSNLLGGLFGVFYDSLPSGWGELLLDRMLYKKGINPKSITSLTKLTIISKNGLGALEYEPCFFEGDDDLKYDLDELSKEANEILDNDNNENLDTLYKYGGSSGGARPKAHIKYNDTEYIVKFPCKMDNYEPGMKEYEANKLAEKCGINVNEYKLFDSKISSGYFGAKRFDRNGDYKIHTISLAGLLETSYRIPNLDYGHLFFLINKICKDNEELYEAFRRMCFNVYFINKDDHSKNFSFIYDETKKIYKLSPQYDITKTLNKFEHEMTVNHNGNPSDDDILELAKTFNLDINRCKEIIKNIKKITKKYPEN